MMRSLPVILAGALLMACSGSSEPDRTLELRSGSFTESEFATEVRVLFASDTSICPAIRDLSIAEIIDFIEALPSNVTPAQNIAVSQDDKERASEIIRDECERIEG